MSPDHASLAHDLAAAGLDWLVPEWPAPEGVRAFSTTRNIVAVSSADESGAGNDDLPAQLSRWLPSPPQWLRQMHGAAIHNADAPATAAAPRADGIVSHGVDTVCAIQTADCLPVLFADRMGSVVAAAHAGWRGLAEGVLEATLAAMRVDRASVLAWIGPGIGAQVYEVGGDVFDAHCRSDPQAAACFAPVSPGKWLADLRALARRRMTRAGVRSVYGADHCTYSEPRRFHSYRRDGARAGRMVTLIWRAR
jgi:purine-nucleoside/S-methyl-5'-thioadenosine phosphorylase / adenosine deaminase